MEAMCQNMWKNPPELPIDAGIIKTKKKAEKAFMELWKMPLIRIFSGLLQFLP